MGLEAAYSIAQSGLSDISNQIAVVSQNIANAGTTAYASEVAGQTEVAAQGQGMGVKSVPTTLVVDAALDARALTQNAVVSGLQTTSTALGSVDTALGATASGNDLTSLLGSLQSDFSTLETDPSSQVQQNVVVAGAQTLATTINSLASTYTQVRQTAQDDLVSAVAGLNTNLATIGSLSKQIILLRAQGLSTADLENQRRVAMTAVSQLVSVKFLPQSNGAVQAFTAAGQFLPLDGGTPLSIQAATIGTTTTAAGTTPNGAPEILLNGTTNVTRSMTGGQIGANLTLRDVTLPTYQAELDEFSAALANRFGAQGLKLFTDSSGSVPALSSTSPVQASYVGFSSTIQVNPAVLATPSLVRDGTTNIAGSSTGASAFTTNPSGGPAGFTTLISRVITYSFGANVQANVAQPAMNTTGLGQSATLSAPFSPQATLSDAATALVASQAADSGGAADQLGTEQSVQTALRTQVSAISGVSVDAQMSLLVQLQNAYGANAKIIAAAAQMWNVLVGATATTQVG
jgi:flagellar hook-associated protein 1 FlgK